MTPMRDEDFVRREYQNARAGSDDETYSSTCCTKNRNYALQLNNDVNGDARVIIEGTSNIEQAE